MIAVQVAICFCIIQATVMGIEMAIPGAGTDKAVGEPWTLMDLEGLKQSLQETQNGTGNAAAEIGQAVTTAISDIETALQDAAARFNSTAQSIVALAKTLSKAEDECVFTATPLDNATLGFVSDVEHCLEADMKTVIGIGEKAVEIRYNLDQLERDTHHTMYICGDSNVASNGVCWTENLPALISQTISLVAEVEEVTLELTDLVPILVVKFDICTGLAFAKRASEAESIIVQSLKCLSKTLTTRRQ